MIRRHNRTTMGRWARGLAMGLLAAVVFADSGPALSQTAEGEPQPRYLVVWKSRYNDRDYRSQWFYCDPAMAESVADELRTFHAFKDVRVITVPVRLSPDGISGKLVRDTYAGRGTGAFTVTDLWNYSVPGSAGGGGDSQVISLRRADPPSSSDSGATTTRPAAPTSGGQPARERLVYDENAPKGQKPGVQTTSPKKSLGANERPVKEEILGAKSEVLQSEQQRLDKERRPPQTSCGRRRRRLQEEARQVSQRSQGLQRTGGAASDGPGCPSGEVRSSNKPLSCGCSSGGPRAEDEKGGRFASQVLRHQYERQRRKLRDLGRSLERRTSATR